MPLMSAGHPGFIRRGSVEPMHRVPERREWGLLARVIPDGCRDSSSVAGDARHLGQSTHRVLHEMDDELGERCIELIVSERQLLRGSDLHLNSWMPLSGSDGELVRRVNRSTDDVPRRVTSSVVSAPGPQPTSSTRWPDETWAKSAKVGARWIE
jgi:hypothetical protein